MRNNIIATIMLGSALLAPNVALAGGACDFGKPNPDAPEEMGQYSFIIGAFDIHMHAWREGGWTEQYREARWDGRYILNGWAVMDEWYGASLEESPNFPGGVNLRMYDAEEGIWKLMWMHTGQFLATELRSQVEEEDGYMHMWRIHPTPDERKVVFETYDADHWARIVYRKDEAGENWLPQFKLDAFRRPCG